MARSPCEAVVRVVFSVGWDFLALIGGIFVAGVLPEDFSGGKFLTDKGCAVAACAFLLGSLLHKVIFKAEWWLPACSLVIPAVAAIVMWPAMDDYWLLRLFDFAVIPIVAVMWLLTLVRWFVGSSHKP